MNNESNNTGYTFDYIEKFEDDFKEVKKYCFVKYAENLRRLVVKCDYNGLVCVPENCPKCKYLGVVKRGPLEIYHVIVYREILYDILNVGLNNEQL